MADLDLLHTAEIVKAAIPFVDGRTQGMADLFVKVCDLMGSMKAARKPQNLAACGFAFENIDVEGLLAAVRPVCSNRERDIVDRILNLFHMKKMFEMYNNMMEAMKTMQEFGGFPFGDTNPDDASNVASNFAGPNFESIFQAFTNFTAQSTDNTEGTTASNHAAGEDMANTDVEHTDNEDMGNRHHADIENIYVPDTGDIYTSDTGNTYASDTGNTYASNTGDIPDMGNIYNSHRENIDGSDMGYKNNVDWKADPPTMNTAVEQMSAPQMDESVQDILRDIKSSATKDSAAGNKGSGSAPMFDMLKSMIPSDKMGTFENLSMLFNSMSYDNNSKTDDQKGE